MKRIYLIILLGFALLVAAQAQELTVKSMAVAGNDISASQYERKDLNGQACALVKVLLASPGAVFEGNVIGDVAYKTGEYWVYLTEGTKELRIKHPQTQPLQVVFNEHGVEKVTGKTTYMLSVLLPGAEANTKQQFTIQYTPQDAIVIIDSKPYQGSGGKVTALLPVGQHDYLVTASGYEPVDGSIRLKAAAPTTLRIELEKTNVTSTVSPIADDVDSEIAGLTTEQIRILGYDYIYGKDGKSVDYAKALRYSRIAADRGDAKAIHNVGYLYLNGHGVSRDYDEAVKWFRKAAEMGSVAGQCNLGYMYYKGYGVTQNYSEAFKWFKKGADRGDSYSMFWLGLCHEEGHGTPKNLSEALRWYKKAAELGDEEARDKVMKLSSITSEVSEDAEIAGKNPSQIYDLAYDYDMGQNGKVRDDAKVVKYYTIAAEKGNAKAQCNLGWMYLIGDGVTQDNAKALKWLKMSAEQGYASGQVYYGMMFDWGRGVTQSDTEAVKWYRKAAEQGDSYGQFWYGYMYDSGRGVTQDYAAAVKWYKKAADKGDADAQCNLGLKYEYGQGVAKDLKKAKYWYEKAASQGNERAKENLKRLSQ